MSDIDPVPRNMNMTTRVEEPSVNPDYISEISFVEHLTDELMLLIQRNVKMAARQNESLEREIKRYLNKAL